MTSFSSTFFIGNRNKLADMLPGHLLVIPAHSLVQYSADQNYRFRQDSNFWYLCGLDEPDALLLIDTDTRKSSVLLRKKNAYQKEWDGKRNLEELKKRSGIDDIGSIGIFNKTVEECLKKGMEIGFIAASKNRIEPYGFYANPSRKLLASRLNKLVNKSDLHDIRLEIAQLRQVKQPVEIAAIRAAIAVTAATLALVKDTLATFKNEKDIERAITAGFYANGSDGHAYDPIVASGANAAIIHYNANCKKLAITDLLLLDVGAKVDGYAADISRTWSLGAPSDRQKEVFAACLAIQEKGISLLRPGVLLKDVQEELANYSESVFKELNCSMAGKPFPHGFSHFLGFDVHDAGDYSMPLQPGVVLTMEPGIYLADEDIGVRIEDDILITQNGAENLSISIPKLL